MRLIYPDTIAKRLALAILLAMTTAVLLYSIFVEVAGVWARPPFSETGLEQQIVMLVRIYSDIPEGIREQIAKNTGTDQFTIEWRREFHADLKIDNFQSVQNSIRNLLHDPTRRVAIYEAGKSDGDAAVQHIFNKDQYGLVVSLSDGSWLVFHVAHRSWGMNTISKYTLILSFILVTAAFAAWLTARSLVRPLKSFSNAARVFASDPNAPPLTPSGSAEMRAAIASFNAMQVQIRRFITDRTQMLAAISHDLRTPLTRIRLRGEFIKNTDQRDRLFRDVADMQTMIDSALGLLRDETLTESATDFSLSELIQVIVDDLGDQGYEIEFTPGTSHIFNGRPFALKRAFSNIIENACYYGNTVFVSIEDTFDVISIFVRDTGPGLPPDLLETVFTPFFRVERSRNRKTGGVGLGLTSARAIVRGHGGDIVLANHANGGLLASVVLARNSVDSHLQ